VKPATELFSCRNAIATSRIDASTRSVTGWITPRAAPKQRTDMPRIARAYPPSHAAEVLDSDRAEMLDERAVGVVRVAILGQWRHGI
jgi:hypothetical protein